MQYSAERLAQAGLNKMPGDALRARYLLSCAVTINPLSVDNRLGLARAMEASPNEEQPTHYDVQETEAAQQLKKAVQLRPASAEVSATIGEKYLSMGQSQEAWPYLSRSVELAPLQLRRYQKAAEAALQIGESELAKSNADSYQWLLKPPELYMKMQTMASRQPYRIGKLERMPMHDPLLGLMTGKAQSYRGNYQAAQDAFRDADKSPVFQNEARAWMIMIRAKEKGLMLTEVMILAEEDGIDSYAFSEMWEKEYTLLGKAVESQEQVIKS